MFSYALAALVLGVGVVGAWAWRGRGLGAAGSSDPSPAVATSGFPSVPAIGVNTVAKVIGLSGCRWANPEMAVTVGQPVAVGRKLVLASGKLEIAYDIGDRVTLEGPATFEVSSATGGKLSVGKLTFRSMLADLLGPVSDLPRRVTTSRRSSCGRHSRCAGRA